MARWKLCAIILVPLLCMVYASNSSAHGGQLSTNSTDDMSRQIELNGKRIDSIAASIENSTDKMEDDISAAGEAIDSKDAVQRVEDEGELVELYSEIMDQITEKRGKDVEDLVHVGESTGSKHENISSENNSTRYEETSGYDPVDATFEKEDKEMEKKQTEVEQKGRLVEEIGESIERPKRWMNATIATPQVETITKTPNIQSSFGIKFKDSGQGIKQKLSGKVNQQTSNEIHRNLRLHTRKLLNNRRNLRGKIVARSRTRYRSWFHPNRHIYTPQKVKTATAARKSDIGTSQRLSLSRALQENVKSSWREVVDRGRNNSSNPSDNTTYLQSNANSSAGMQKDYVTNSTDKGTVIVPLEKERLGKLLVYSFMSEKLKKGDFKAIEDAFTENSNGTTPHFSGKELQSILEDDKNESKVIKPKSANGTNISNSDIEQLLSYIKTLNNSILQNNETASSTQKQNYSDLSTRNYSDPVGNTTRIGMPKTANSPVGEIISDIRKEMSDISSKFQGKGKGKVSCNTTECVARELIRRLGQKFLKESGTPRAAKDPYASIKETHPHHVHHEDYKETEQHIEDDDDHHTGHLHQIHDYDNADTFHHDVHDVFIDDPRTNHVHVAPPPLYQPRPEPHNSHGGGVVHHVHHHYHHHTPGVKWVSMPHPMPGVASGQEPEDEDEIEEEEEEELETEHHGEETEGTHRQVDYIEPEYLRHESSDLPGVIPPDQLPPLIPPAEHLSNMLASIEHHMSSNVVMPPLNDMTEQSAFHSELAPKFDYTGFPKREEDPGTLLDTMPGAPFNPISVPDTSPSRLIEMKPMGQDLVPEMPGATIRYEPDLRYEMGLQTGAIKKTLLVKHINTNSTTTPVVNKSVDFMDKPNNTSPVINPKDTMKLIKRAFVGRNKVLRRVKHRVHVYEPKYIPNNGQGVAYLNYLTEKYGQILEHNLREKAMDVEEVGRDIERKVNKGVRKVTHIGYKVEVPDYDRHGRFYPSIHPEDVEDEVNDAMSRYVTQEQRNLEDESDRRPNYWSYYEGDPSGYYPLHHRHHRHHHRHRHDHHRRRHHRPHHLRSYRRLVPSPFEENYHNQYERYYSDDDDDNNDDDDDDDDEDSDYNNDNYGHGFYNY